MEFWGSLRMQALLVAPGLWEGSGCGLAPGLRWETMSGIDLGWKESGLQHLACAPAAWGQPIGEGIVHWGCGFTEVGACLGLGYGSRGPLRLQAS